MTNKQLICTLSSLIGAGAIANGAVISVTESGGEPERSIVENGGAGIFDASHSGTNVADGTLFGEDVNVFTDRAHEHNGAAFDATTGLLSTAGTNIISLPTYLVGNEYVRFANDGRDNASYSYTVTTDVASTFYLLLDTRATGAGPDRTAEGMASDPLLEGGLAWVTADGWSRVNTGISPDGQADYTGVDEGGESVGAGVGLNTFYAVFSKTGTSVTLQDPANAGGNNFSLVVAEGAGAIPEPSSVLLMGLAGLGLLRRRR